MGVPQGSVLSVTLFSVKINSIVDALGPDIHKCLYVDDFTISYCSQIMACIERKLQNSLYHLSNWANENGFKFSTTKTVCMHFCNRRGLHPDPVLHLNNNPIPIVEKTKFLGLIFDRKLTFKAHIDYLRVKCQAGLQLLRTISKLDWGADRETMLRFFRALIRSRIDYGAPVYGSARPSYLLKLKPVQNQALRLCLGAFRTSPIVSLHAEAGESPMHIRRAQLGVQYAIKIATDPENPANESIFNNRWRHLYDAHPRRIKPLGYRIAEPLSRVCPDTSMLLPRLISSDMPYWFLKHPEIDTTMTQFDKHATNAIELRHNFCDLLLKYPEHVQFYTDGSRSESAVACAGTGNDMTLQIRLPDAASIYTAELTAILETLNILQRSPHQSILIITDSLSALEALHHLDFKHPLVFKILSVYTEMSPRDTVFMWCPSHVGIRGNETADLLARQALSYQPCDFRIPFRDFYQGVKVLFRSQWQSEWDTT
jgi:ribonuclease HI